MTNTETHSHVLPPCVNPDHAPLFTPEGHAKYIQASPFAHTYIDNFLKPEYIEKMLAEFDETAGSAKYYHHYNEKKRGCTDFDKMGPGTQQVIRELNSDVFLKTLGVLTGVDALIADPSLDGGGLHEMRRGGFLNVHTDFQSHTINRNWSRKCNLLLFLNKDWKEEYNGSLELWDKKVKTKAQKIMPIFNRCVIFNTTDASWHGVPDTLQCPEDQSRKSLALYYFRAESAECELKPTNYQPRPDDSIPRRILIRLDRSAVAGYSFMKRYLGGDALERKVSNIFKKFSK